jgi:hypothetical protein
MMPVRSVCCPSELKLEPNNGWKATRCRGALDYGLTPVQLLQGYAIGNSILIIWTSRQIITLVMVTGTVCRCDIAESCDLNCQDQKQYGEKDTRYTQQVGLT